MSEEETENTAVTIPELHVGRFYRIDGSVLYCVRATWYKHAVGPDEIHMEGILPEDYAAYITHQVIGENQHPYRTVAEVEHIPRPESVQIQFSTDAKVEVVSKEDALQERSGKQETALRLLDDLENWVRYSKSSFYLVNISEREAILTIEWLKKQAKKPEQKACICDQYAGIKGSAEWTCPQHGKCSTGWATGYLKPEQGA